MTIQEIRHNERALTTEQLEREKQRRDDAIASLRAEMTEIHEILEPRWARETAAAMGPAHLRQRFSVGGVSEVLSLKG